MKDINLMKWDNCYTFVLKALGIFGKYKTVESDDFVEMHHEKMIPFPGEAFIFKDFDVFVSRFKKGPVKYKAPREIKNGVILSQITDYWHYHFDVFYQDVFYDLIVRDKMYNEIVATHSKDLLEDLVFDKKEYFVLRESDIL